MKKAILFFLVLLMLTSGLVSCKTKTTTQQSSAPEVSDDPLLDANFEGRTFTILQRTERSYEFKESEEASGFVNTKIAERNAYVEERYNVKLNTIEVKGDWASWNTFTDYVTNSIMSDSAEYDLISGYAVSMPTLTSSDFFVNWYELDEYMNFEAEWWYQDFIDQMTINNRMYMISGDLALTMWDAMQGMFFNKTLVEANPDVENLYNVVRSGKWTFDYFNQVLKTVYPDEDVSEEQKVYSYGTFKTTQIDVYQDAFDIPVTEKDDEGKPYFTIGSNPKILNAVQWMNDLVYNEYTLISSESQNSTTDDFGKGRCIFAPLPLGDGNKLQNYAIDYGILPMPKYDEAQEQYHTTCEDFYSVFSVPVTSQDDLKFVGILTEALCYYSNKTVASSYYEQVLKLRNTYDEDSIEMIDTIRNGILCNFGYLYSMTLNWPAHQLNVLINAKNTNWVSNWESKIGTFETNLEKELEVYFAE